MATIALALSHKVLQSLKCGPASRLLSLFVFWHKELIGKFLVSGAEESSRLWQSFPICAGQIMRWYLRAGAEQPSRTGASIRRESPSCPDGGARFAEVPPGSLQV